MVGQVPQCVKCVTARCWHPDVEGAFPVFCPSQKYSEIKLETIKKKKTDKETRRITLAVEDVIIRGDVRGNSKWTRIEEVMELAGVLEFRRLGLAFCVGLKEEARILADILEKNNFQVVSVCCMAGGPTRKELGVRETKYLPSIVCNPLMQAEVLNNEKTELNIMVGLCVGHDMLFIRNSKAYVIPLIVKDRVLGHNPVAALYTAETYYKKLFHETFK
jgi:uncharacterized metal-binding protein